MKVLALFLVVLVAVFGVERSEAQDGFSFDQNALVDQVLEGARSELSQSGKDKIDLPDIYEGFKKKIAFVHISGHFAATQGWAKSLTSLSRTGPVTLTQDGDKIVLDAQVGLSDLQVGYNYKAKLGKMGPSGTITATVTSNSIHLRGSMLMTDSACSLGIDSVELQDLGKINVHATGLGKLNFLYSKIVTLVTNKLRSKIQNTANDAIRKAIQKAALNNKSCDSLFAL